MNNKLKHKLLSEGKTFEHVSEQYAPVNTQLFLEPFFRRGWGIEKTKTISNKQGQIHKEVVTLVNPDFISLHGPIQLTVINSYDARSSLKIYAGIHRLVCSNGLILMVEGESFRFIHRGESIYDKLDNAYDKIVAYLNTVNERIELLSNTEPTTTMVTTVITNIAKRVFEKDNKTTKVELNTIPLHVIRNLGRIRREADKKPDMFTIFNVIQENITRRGLLSAQVKEINKETNQVEFKTVNKRATESKLSDIKLNQIITEEFLKAVS